MKDHNHEDRKEKAKRKQKDLDRTDRKWVQYCINYEQEMEQSDIQDDESGLQ